MILISHDRDFLDRVVHAVVVPEGDGRWGEYAGGYSEMLAQRGAEFAGKRAAKGKTAKGAKAAAEPAASPARPSGA